MLFEFKKYGEAVENYKHAIQKCTDLGDKQDRLAYCYVQVFICRFNDHCPEDEYNKYLDELNELVDQNPKIKEVKD